MALSKPFYNGAMIFNELRMKPTLNKDDSNNNVSLCLQIETHRSRNKSKRHKAAKLCLCVSIISSYFYMNSRIQDFEFDLCGPHIGGEVMIFLCCARNQPSGNNTSLRIWFVHFRHHPG
jgi:hypothetical protein